MRASRRGSGDCVGRLRRAAARYVRVDLESHPAGDLEPVVATRPASSRSSSGSSSSSSSSSTTHSAPEAWPQFFGYIRGRGEGGWFSAPQPLIVGAGAPSSQVRCRIFSSLQHKSTTQVYNTQTVLNTRPERYSFKNALRSRYPTPGQSIKVRAWNQRPLSPLWH